MSTRLTPAERVIRAEPEEAFASWVVDAAHLYGWRVAHFRPARTAHGWRTPVQADGAGFPDLVMLHDDGRAVVVELKRQQGAATPEQTRWLDLFAAAGFTAEVWRPADRERILALLEKSSARVQRRPTRVNSAFTRVPSPFSLRVVPENEPRYYP